jgi:hypothetical protein
LRREIDHVKNIVSKHMTEELMGREDDDDGAELKEWADE